MKNNQKHEEEQEHDIEILKAVAQAWHGHSTGSRAASATSEFDAHRRHFKGKATRFKLEAMSIATKKEQYSNSWDFGQSLWDSYEIVTVSKKLEAGLVLDDPLSALNEGAHGVKRRKESSRSLRNLFNRMSSRRFTEEDLPYE